MSLERLGRGDIIAAGGGLLLLVSLFIPWYGVTGGEDVCGAGVEDCNFFQTSLNLFFIPMPILFVLGALAPWILVWIVVRQHELSWPPGELTMISGLIAFVLVLYIGLLDQPGQNSNFVSLDIGWYLGLVGTIAIIVGGAISQTSRGGVTRKPPGSF